ncbi:MAG: Hpt domain-containing protein [Planctomycetota bacterium]
MDNNLPNHQEHLTSELAGDSEMLELIEMFVDELPARVQALQDAVKENDLAALATLAHQLKGSAGGYGFPWITEAAKALENSTKQAADLSAIQTQLETLTDLCNRSVATERP